MRYRPLGRTGIVVSEFCLGTMMLGEWGNTDESECHRMVHRALDADIDETLGALSDLIHLGKVRAIGTSAFPAEQLVEAQWVSERRGRERFATEQLSYSILARQAEAAVLPTAERYGLGVLVFS